MGEKIMVGVANEGELSIYIEIIKKWKPTDIVYFINVVFFKEDKSYYSMKKLDFDKLFKN